MSGPQLALPLDGRLPIVVGVTGHRDLDPRDVPMLEAAVADRLVGLLETYRHTPVVVLDALAEGADQLVARVVCGLRSQYGGRLFLVAALPWDEATYFTTFDDQSDASRDVLRDAIVDADLAYTVAEVEDDPVAAPSDAKGEEEGFRRLAAFLVRNAHVLLCLADEVAVEGSRGSVFPRDEGGGTETVLRWFRDGLPERYSPGCCALDVAEGLALEHVPVRRVKRAAPRPPAPPRPERPQVEVFTAFEGFNRELDMQRPNFGGRFVASGQSLLEYGKDAARPPEELAPVRDAYAVADILTDRRYKDVIESFIVVAVVLIGVAILAFELFTYCPSYEFLAVNLTLVLVAGGYARWVRYQTFDERRLAFRALAEALRLQAHWWYAGVPQVVANQFPRHARNEVDWIRQAVRGLYPCCGPATRARDPWTGVGVVYRGWLVDQSRWLLRRARLDLACSRRRVRLVTRLGLGLGLGLGAWLLFRHFVLGAPAAPVEKLDDTTRLLVIVMICSYGAAGLAGWVDHTKAYGPLQRRYLAQQEIYRRARTRLRALLERRGEDDLGRARDLLGELGRATVQENMSWLLLFRSRPLEIKW